MKSGTEIKNTPKAKVRVLRILCAAMMSGVTIFTVVFFFAGQTSGAPFASEAAPYRSEILLLLLALAGLAVFYSKYRWNKKMQRTRDAAGELDTKLEAYKAALLSYMSLCEMPSFFAVIVFFLTGEVVFLLVVPLSLFFMGAKLVAIGKLPEELQLNWQEEESLK